MSKKRVWKRTKKKISRILWIVAQLIFVIEAIITVIEFFAK